MLAERRRFLRLFIIIFLFLLLSSFLLRVVNSKFNEIRRELGVLSFGCLVLQIAIQWRQVLAAQVLAAER